MVLTAMSLKASLSRRDRHNVAKSSVLQVTHKVWRIVVQNGEQISVWNGVRCPYVVHSSYFVVLDLFCCILFTFCSRIRSRSSVDERSESASPRNQLPIPRHSHSIPSIIAWSTASKPFHYIQIQNGPERWTKPHQQSPTKTSDWQERRNFISAVLDTQRSQDPG
jgi:hypothetical protein